MSDGLVRLVWAARRDQADWLAPHPVVSRRARLASGVFTSIWVVYLVDPVVQIWQHGSAARTAAIIAVVVPFAVLYIGAVLVFHRIDADGLPVAANPDSRAWVWLATMAVLAAAGIWLSGGVGVAMVMYVVMVGIFILPSRSAALVATVGVTLFALLPMLLPHSGMPVGVSLTLAAVIAMVIAGRLITGQNRKLEAGYRRQRAELALVEERNRVARDVHDILGHSLTVITVKSELAQRLIDIDMDRARGELRDIERLAREALAGVRETVGGLREVSLEGELANARTALAAAGIEPQLPADVTATPPALRPVLGWVLREGVTNVVRHSGARRCVVTVRPNGIEIVDDGKGFDPDPARACTGLDGLRQRVDAAGGTLRLGAHNGRGFRLAAEFPAHHTNDDRRT